MSGKIVAEKCYCSINGGCCPGGVSESSNASDEDGHGTNVAGIVASQDSTNRGIAYNASIYAVKVFGAGTGGSTLDIGDGIDWCRGQGVNIISMSLGDAESHPGDSICPDYYNSEINNAYKNNIFIDAASGNDGYNDGVNYPACQDNVTSVGSVYDENVGLQIWSIVYFPWICVDWTTSADKIVCETSRGLNLKLLAPGCEITSTGLGEGTSTYCGTSQAAPHVAGAAALMLDKNSTLTPNQIKIILQDTGKPIWDSATNLTFKRINVADAIEAVPFDNCTAGNWTSGSCGAGNCSSIQRQYTRTVNPSGCDAISKCEYDETCVGGGTITVCKGGGCDYTTIQGAINSAAYEDLIKITDQGTYDEDVNMSATPDKIFLNCQGATITSSNDALRIDSNEYSVIMNCIFNATNGIHITGDSDNNEFLNNVFDVEEKGLESIGSASGAGGSLDIIDNIFINAGEYGVYFHGVTGEYPDAGYFMRNSFFNNAHAMHLTRSIWNEIYNSLFEGNNYGIYLQGSNYDLEETIDGNNLSENSYGIYIDDQDGVMLTNNHFCPSNSEYDIAKSLVDETYGLENTCEKPDGWNDNGVTGCTYYCDTPAEVILLYPNNNSTYITQGNVNLVCQSDDNYQLVNVSLYHNLSGTWQLNQTKNISGTTNTTIFTLTNIPNGTTFEWNCLAYDNMSRGSFASVNWSVNVIIDNVSPDVNIISPLNQTYNISSIDFNVSINEDGTCEYSLNNGVTNISMSTIDNRNFSATNSSMANGNYISRFYCKDAIGNLNNTKSVNFSVNAPIPPTDTHKFYIKNSSNNNVAWLGNLGNIVLKGRCFSGGNCNNPGANSFIVKNLSNNNVAFINSTGDLCIIIGDCSDEGASCNPTRNAFIIRDSLNNNRSYIDFDGDLCLTGKLYENSNF